MRIDHIAFRVHDRAATVNFLRDALGYVGPKPASRSRR